MTMNCLSLISLDTVLPSSCGRAEIGRTYFQRLQNPTVLEEYQTLLLLIPFSLSVVCLVWRRAQHKSLLLVSGSAAFSEIKKVNRVLKKYRDGNLDFRANNMCQAKSLFFLLFFFVHPIHFT